MDAPDMGKEGLNLWLYGGDLEGVGEILIG
jgi:hypothetical protein